jgi:hypothetical protein
MKQAENVKFLIEELEKYENNKHILNDLEDEVKDQEQVPQNLDIHSPEFLRQT